MRTLYLRNVPEHVMDCLERLAAQENMSVSALAVRELGAAVRRADNPALLGKLPDLRVDPAGILTSLDAERPTR